MMEFIYILKLIDRLVDVNNWTDSDELIIGEHFNHLLKLKEDGKLLLAGKTDGNDKDTKGIVIFKASTMEEAKNIMNSDPAIRKGIMTGTLQKYSVAILNKEYKKD